MARMSIDDSIQRDPRITELAQILGWSRRETVGCLIQDVWPICYDQRTHIIVSRMIDIAAGREGFAAAMVKSHLAKTTKGGKVIVAGAAERIEYLDHKRKAGRVGGLKSAEVRAKNSSTTPSSGSSTPQAAGNPSASASSPDPVLPPDPVPASVPDPVQKNKKPSASPPVPFADGQVGIDSFHGYFVRTHNGEKPTWDGRSIKRMHELVRTRGLDTVLRRLEVLETAPPTWPPPPWDLVTFIQHFDKVAAPSGARLAQRAGGVSDAVMRIANGESK